MAASSFVLVLVLVLVLVPFPVPHPRPPPRLQTGHPDRVRVSVRPPCAPSCSRTGLEWAPTSIRGASLGPCRPVAGVWVRGKRPGGLEASIYTLDVWTRPLHPIVPSVCGAPVHVGADSGFGAGQHGGPECERAEGFVTQRRPSRLRSRVSVAPQQPLPQIQLLDPAVKGRLRLIAPQQSCLSNALAKNRPASGSRQLELVAGHAAHPVPHDAHLPVRPAGPAQEQRAQQRLQQLSRQRALLCAATTARCLPAAVLQ